MNTTTPADLPDDDLLRRARAQIDIARPSTITGLGDIARAHLADHDQDWQAALADLDFADVVEALRDIIDGITALQADPDERSSMVFRLFNWLKGLWLRLTAGTPSVNGLIMQQEPRLAPLGARLAGLEQAWSGLADEYRDSRQVLLAYRQAVLEEQDIQQGDASDDLTAEVQRVSLGIALSTQAFRLSEDVRTIDFRLTKLGHDLDVLRQFVQAVERLLAQARRAEVPLSFFKRLAAAPATPADDVLEQATITLFHLARTILSELEQISASRRADTAED